MKRLGAAGFTLLELLVAIAVFAVLGVMAVGALTSSMRSSEIVQDQQTRLAAIQFAIAVITRDIEQTVARPIRDRFGDDSPSVETRAGTTEFTRGGRPNPLGRNRATLERVSYRRAEDQLIRSAWPVLDRGPGTEPDVTELLDGVEDFRVRWHTGQGQWLEYWPPAGNREAWPRAAEVSLVLADLGTLSRLVVLADGPRPEPDDRS